jgi:hypothetical protein
MIMGDIYKMNETADVWKAMYISANPGCGRKSTLGVDLGEKEYMQDEWKTEYLQPDEDTTRKKGCQKVAVSRTVLSGK